MNTEKMRDSAMKLLLSLEEMDAGLLMLSVVLTMLLAILIGSYRYYCIYMKRKAPWNVPRLWGHSSFKVVSWILFVVPSLWAASAVGILITRYIGGIAGQVAFFIVFCLCWLISAWLGTIKSRRELQRFEAFCESGVDSPVIPGAEEQEAALSAEIDSALDIDEDKEEEKEEEEKDKEKEEPVAVKKKPPAKKKISASKRTTATKKKSTKTQRTKD